MQSTIIWTISLISFIAPYSQGAKYECPVKCYCRDETKSVFCNRTGISEVPKNIPKNVVTLNLGQNNIQSIPKDALKELKNLTYLDISGNRFTDQSFLNGALNITSIQSLDLSMGSYMTVPQGLPPNLVTLYFFDNPIQVLTAGSFVNASSIQNLEFRYNQLRKIEDHAFDPLVNASEIDISFNKLTDGSIPQLAFVKNKKVWNLQMRFNALTKFPNTNYYPKSLQHLDFVGNRITTIPSYALQTLTNLQSLEMWQGEIREIQDNAFYGLNKVTILDFMQDHVSSNITNSTFNGLTSLQTLYIDLNSILNIEVGAFYAMKNVQSLWLGSNQISRLDKGTFDLSMNPSLNTLYLDDNPWICDCHLRWLRQMMDDHPDLIQDPHLVVCSGPSPVTNKAWDVLKPEQFVCP